MRNARFVRPLILATLLAVMTLTGAVRSPTTAGGDEGNVRAKAHSNSRESMIASAIEVSASLPDPSSDGSTFYSVRSDLQRCVSPLCGGFFVKRVNHVRTRCANGRWMSECYVAEVDWNNQPQVEPAKALLRGSIVAKTFGTFGNLGALRVTESWQAVTDKRPSGDFYGVRDRGVRCITFPCPTHQEAKLNSSLSRNIAGVDLATVGMEAQDQSRVFQALTGPEAAVLAGTHISVRGPGGRSVELKATQVYLRVQTPSSRLPCIKTGCSRQICADHNVVTTCEYRPEYACYEKARCERQADGNCGFTLTRELTACLSRK